MLIDQSVVLITGGASGLGAASARHLAQAGARVVVADLDQAAVENIAREIGATGARARAIAANVTDEASVQRAVDLALSEFGALHVLINCAGIAPAALVSGKNGPHALELFKRVIDVNLVGTFNAIRLAAPAMQRNTPNDEGERGVIINTASIAAFDGQIGQAAYSASKAGIVGITLPIARELARNGIRVMTIAPGIFETPMLRGLPPEVQASLGKQVPFPPRLGKPQEYAALAAHIVANAMLNGEVIRLDGAIRMAPK
ncbi:MAG: 3-hydroxyacyl-CoA dehydrogenase [Betaproteobacteria bacterium]|nr:3-hydroxyacyl-CoA dehydrogenase [Betaproteobacteria bacterium]